MSPNIPPIFKVKVKTRPHSQNFVLKERSQCINVWTVNTLFHNIHALLVFVSFKKSLAISSQSQNLPPESHQFSCCQKSVAIRPWIWSLPRIRKTHHDQTIQQTQEAPHSKAEASNYKNPRQTHLQPTETQTEVHQTAEKTVPGKEHPKKTDSKYSILLHQVRLLQCKRPWSGDKLDCQRTAWKTRIWFWK